MDNNLLVSERESILEVTLNRAEKLNALTDSMVESLGRAIATFSERRDLRVMLIRAAGKYFTSGVEIGPDISPNVGESTLDGRRWYRNKYHLLFDELEAVEKPVVAAHQGPCFGGGLEFSLSCDFRLAARSASYALPELNIGALPGSGGVSRLTRIAGPHWARWLAMAGEQVTAEQAVGMGFVHAVYPDEEFAEKTWAFCRKLTQLSYEFLGLAKLSIELAADLDRGQARNVERISNSILFTGSEHKERVQKFMERQAAKRAARQSPPSDKKSG
ncbi:MAG TPA: enoyl-CoA hydratase/isomerase family protein [Steroidobacteraceae bacterium]|nr:enoyl-CoA hydratase/isomerase family protein [Steroidobacteraceae bacterium]